MDRGTQGGGLFEKAFMNAIRGPVLGRGAWAIWMVPLLLTIACGGGGGDTVGSSTSAVAGRMTVSWNANHEKSVNAPGGGYYVYYANAPGVNTQTASMIQVPYVSGTQAPTSIQLSNLAPGTYYFRVPWLTAPSIHLTEASREEVLTRMKFQFNFHKCPWITSNLTE